MKSFEERAYNLMQNHPEEVRKMARSTNKFEAAMAEIVIETAERGPNTG